MVGAAVWRVQELLEPKFLGGWTDGSLGDAQRQAGAGFDVGDMLKCRLEESKDNSQGSKKTARKDNVKYSPR